MNNLNPTKQSKQSLNLTGQSFGKLTAIRCIGVDNHGNAIWECSCDCGGSRNAAASHLKGGDTQSCGCITTVDGRWTTETKNRLKHGMTETPTWLTWRNMLSRCNKAIHPQYPDYGGRGITVCPEWSEFENFFRDMGKQPPRHTLDRIDNNGNYHKNNCRWATPKEQARNRRSNRLLQFGDKNVTIAEWSEVTGISYANIHARLRLGWSIGQALGFEPRK